MSSSGSGKTRTLSIAPLVLRVGEAHQRHAVVGDVAAYGGDLLADHHLHSDFLDALQIRARIPAVEFAQLRREAPCPRRRDGKERHRVMPADGNHMAELHCLGRSACEVDQVEAAQIVQQGFGCRVALAGRIIVRVADQARVGIPLEVECALRQPRHRLRPRQQRLAQVVVLRLDEHRASWRRARARRCSDTLPQAAGSGR